MRHSSKCARKFEEGRVDSIALSTLIWNDDSRRSQCGRKAYLFSTGYRSGAGTWQAVPLTNASAGSITSNGFSADFVFNVVSGQSTLFLQTSIGVGVNFSVQAGFTFGTVYGIGGDNSNFTNLTSSVNVGVGSIQFQTQSFQSNWGDSFATFANSSVFWLSGKMRTENWWKREDSALRAGIFKA
jgi:hypothetical protein